jgi:hypothetical protein
MLNKNHRRLRMKSWRLKSKHRNSMMRKKELRKMPKKLYNYWKMRKEESKILRNMPMT